jgi:hypothetical protein
MIDPAALDRAVRRCRLLLALCRKHGIREDEVRVLMPLIIGHYREECGRDP